MKNPYQVLQQKEREIEQKKQEIEQKSKEVSQLKAGVEALYVVLPLLHEPADLNALVPAGIGDVVTIPASNLQPAPVVFPAGVITPVQSTTAPSLPAQPAVTGWDAAAKRWP